MISRDDWLKAIEQANTPPPQDEEALTVRELAKLFGCQPVNAARIAKKLVDAGKATETTKMVRMSNGAWRAAPAYRLVKDTP